MKQFPLLAFFVAPSTHHRSSSIGTRIIRSNKNDCCGLLRLVSVNNVDGGLSDTNLEPSAGVYEAVIPQTETLVGMGVIVILCVALYLVWENQVVPVSRTKLAISKKRGEVREYLDELKVETTSFEDTVADKSNNAHTKNAISSSVSSPLSSSSLSSPKDRIFERWLFTDWLGDNKSEGKKAGRQKEPALPILKSAKWNSGDNPVVVAVLLMMIGVFITALTERIASISG